MTNFDSSLNSAPDFRFWFGTFQPDFVLRIQSRAMAERHIVRRALRDPHFLCELLASPRSVLAREVRMSIPEIIDVIVLQETEIEKYLIVPDCPTPVKEGISPFSASEGLDWLLDGRRLSLLTSAQTQELIARIWTDADFTQAFLANSKGVLMSEYGIALPPDLKLHVEFEERERIYIVIPHLFGYIENGILEEEFDSKINESVYVGSTTYPCNTM